jgi:hypothetical protein
MTQHRGVAVSLAGRLPANGGCFQPVMRTLGKPRFGGLEHATSRGHDGWESRRIDGLRAVPLRVRVGV